MRTEVDHQTRMTVIELSGKLMGGTDATFFHGLVQQNLGEGGRDFVIDLEHVDWVNSIGLGMLIAAQTSIQKSGGRMALSNIHNIESLLTITRLITIVRTYNSKHEAIQALRAI